MLTSDAPAKMSRVDRRLQAAGMPIEVSIAMLGGSILLVADAWGPCLVPLVANLEKTYSLSPGEAAWTLSVPAMLAVAAAALLVRRPTFVTPETPATATVAKEGTESQ